MATFIDRIGINATDRPRFPSYALAAGAVIIASLLNFTVWPVGAGPDVKYFLLIAVVLASALFSGLGPALLATILSAVDMALFSLAPYLALQPLSGPAYQRLLIFVAEGAMLSILGTVIRRTHQSYSLPYKKFTYLAAPMCVGADLILKTALFPQLAREIPFVFNYATVSVSAWLGGTASGVIATLACALLTRYFFLPPVHSLVVGNETDVVRLGLFVCEGLLLSLLNGSHRALVRLVAELTTRAHGYLRTLLRTGEDLDATRRVSRDIIWEWDLDNGEILRLSGWQDPLSQVLPKRDVFPVWIERIHSEDRVKVLQLLTQTINDGREDVEYTYQILGPNGVYFQISDHAHIVRDASWKPLRVIGRSAHIQGRIPIQPGMPEENRFERMFEMSPTPMLITDIDLHILASNSSARAILRAREGEIANAGLLSFFDSGTRQAATDQFGRLFRWERLSLHFDAKLIRRTGEIFSGLLSVSLTTDFLDGATALPDNNRRNPPVNRRQGADRKSLSLTNPSPSTFTRPRSANTRVFYKQESWGIPVETRIALRQVLETLCETATQIRGNQRPLQRCLP